MTDFFPVDAIVAVMRRQHIRIGQVQTPRKMGQKAPGVGALEIYLSSPDDERSGTFASRMDRTIEVVGAVSRATEAAAEGAERWQHVLEFAGELLVG